jgi:hypothetical protein
MLVARWFVSMYVFVLVEDDFEGAGRMCRGDTAERFQAGDVIAAFQMRIRRLSPIAFCVLPVWIRSSSSFRDVLRDMNFNFS